MNRAAPQLSFFNVNGVLYRLMASQKNFAYIDGANLHRGIKDLGWNLDYHKFRVWLEDKFNVQTAYLFIGLVPRMTDLYTKLQLAGFILVFKEVSYDSNGKVKGNCDADLVLNVLVDHYEGKCDKVVIVTSDGDYAGLIRFLRDKLSLLSLVSPRDRCSFLLRKLNIPIVYLNTQKEKLKLGSKRKSPR